MASSARAHRLEYDEGPDAAQKFQRTLDRVLKVSKDELTRREAEYQKQRRVKKASRNSPR
jgi:hypothetical protein